MGLYALRASVSHVRVVFGSVDGMGRGRSIAGGLDGLHQYRRYGYDGRAFIKRVDVPAGQVQALWCVVQVPEDAAGMYEGMVSVVADGHGVAMPGAMLIRWEGRHDERSWMWGSRRK